MREALIAPKQHDSIEGVLSPSEHASFFGHQDNCNFLDAMLAEGHWHHALLFEGPKGIGKATLAFQLAWNIIGNRQTIFEKPSEDDALWHQILQESHPAFLHLTRRREQEHFRTAITVDDIRAVNRLLERTSSDGGWRVIIVDSADDMNRNAANALLKTLEEPPKKVLFILISHFSGRLLPTIRSRCQALRFFPLQNDVVAKALTTCLQDILFDPNAEEAQKILNKAEGSVRNAALLITNGGLDLLNAIDAILADKTIDYAQLHQLANVVSAKDALIQYQQFHHEILSRIATTAKHHAQSKDQKKAAQWADFWATMQMRLMEADSYNLDKKHFTLTTMKLLHQQLQK